ncbi:MAG: hypothetical protein AB7K24_29910 [Gemmataceae bacterium]
MNVGLDTIRLPAEQYMCGPLQIVAISAAAQEIRIIASELDNLAAPQGLLVHVAASRLAYCPCHSA